MQNRFSETIAAIITAAAAGPVGVIRLSGPHAKDVLLKIFVNEAGHVLAHVEPRHVYYGTLTTDAGETLDKALAVFMPGPNSYTGEDVVELSCHGNPHILRRILRAVTTLDPDYLVRLAEPGEFTRRAFLNGKLSLTQAEAVHELITAESEAAATLSLANLDQRLGVLIAGLRDELTQALALVEASFEFAHENIETYSKRELADLVSQVKLALTDLLAAYKTSRLYDSGVTVALIGAPNVGKSSLLNALLREDRAIVTPIPGTTRDVVEGVRVIDGVRFILRDTAGLRESSDVVEMAGIERSRELATRSDIVLQIIDTTENLSREFTSPFQNNRKIILNKFDSLLDNYSKQSLEQLSIAAQQLIARHKFDGVISATTGFGLSKIDEILMGFISDTNSVQNKVHVNERQHALVSHAHTIIEHLESYLERDAISEEIIAEELKLVVSDLNEITGEISSDDVLGAIFSKFCIGK